VKAGLGKLSTNGREHGVRSGRFVREEVTVKLKTKLLLLAGAAIAAKALSRSLKLRRLEGKRVLITGGSRGLGLVLARQLTREGARVAICARDASELERAAADPETEGVLAITCDVTDQHQVQELVWRVKEEFGEIDILINNAGVIGVGPVETMDLQDYEETMGVHFWGPLYLTLEVLPEMRARGAGHIVNVSSIGGKLSVPHLLPYCASKFALTGFSEGLRAELAKDGVAVTTVCPGLMRTGSPRNATFKSKHRAEYTWFSVFDSLPLLSMSAERAARRIVDALKTNKAEVILTIQAKAAARFNALFPETMAALMALTNRLLPSAGGIGHEKRLGADSASALSPSPLTSLTERAASLNNEVGPADSALSSIATRAGVVRVS